MIRCIIVQKNYFILNKPIFYRWNEKIIQDFNLHMSIDYWRNDCHLPWSFKWHATPYYEWLGKYTCFLQASLYISFEPHQIKVSLSPWPVADLGFITEYHFHPIVHTPWLFLFSLLFFRVLLLIFLWFFSP